MKKEDAAFIRHAIHQDVCQMLLGYQNDGYLEDRESVEIALNVWVAVTKALRSIARQRKAAEVSQGNSPGQARQGE